MLEFRASKLEKRKPFAEKREERAEINLSKKFKNKTSYSAKSKICLLKDVFVLMSFLKARYYTQVILVNMELEIS